MKVRELLTDESKWTKGANARDQDGGIRLSRAEEGVCWCLDGALYRLYSVADYLTVHQRVCRHLVVDLLIDWNDAPERTFQEVKALVEELDI